MRQTRTVHIQVAHAVKNYARIQAGWLRSIFLVLFLIGESRISENGKDSQVSFDGDAVVIAVDAVQLQRPKRDSVSDVRVHQLFTVIENKTIEVFAA